MTPYGTAPPRRGPGRPGRNREPPAVAGRGAARSHSLIGWAGWLTCDQGGKATIWEWRRAQPVVSFKAGSSIPPAFGANQLMAAETGQSVERIAADMDRDFWMSAQEALDYGLLSRLVTKREELDQLV